MSKQTENSQTIVTRSSARNNDNRHSHTANTTNILMDSGNISESLPSTISTPNLTMTNTPTSLNPTDILAFIKEIPSFDGNPSKLQDFITNIEEITTLIQDFETPYHSLLLRAIRNKVIGRANDVLGLSKTDIKWEDIKSNLRLQKERSHTNSRTTNNSRKLVSRTTFLQYTKSQSPIDSYSKKRHPEL